MRLSTPKAEDGIRDFCLSRGLGDVYKRQVKCESLESLKKGEKYAILEFNAVHSGYGHLYHCGKSSGEVYKEIHRLWNVLYDICVAHHKKGAPYMPFFKGWKFIFDSVLIFRKLSKWDKEL